MGVEEGIYFTVLPRRNPRRRGSVGIFGNGSTTAVQALVYNTDLDLVNFVKSAWDRLGYNPLGPYLDKRKGTITSKYRIMRRKDYWKTVVARFDDAKTLLSRLPIRHREKVARNAIAQGVRLGDLWENVRPELDKLRDSIKKERDEFVAEAEREFRRTHPGWVRE